MTAKPVGLASGYDSGMSGTNEASLGTQKKTPAARQHVRARSIKIRSRDVMTTTDTNIVRTLHATTALAPVYEQVLEFAMVINVGGFDGSIVRK